MADWRTACSGLGLRTTMVTFNKLNYLLSQPRATTGEYRELIKELRGRLSDEMMGQLFLHIEVRKADYYNAPLVGLDTIIVHFPSAIPELEEAARCFALSRNTACVFHSMRVLELGLVALAGYFQVPIDRPNWHEILTDIESQVKKLGPDDGTEWRDKQQFGSEACTQFRYFKDAWRNHTMHVRQVFDEGRAQSILDHVKDFMKHLATRLQESL